MNLSPTPSQPSAPQPPTLAPDMQWLQKARTLVEQGQHMAAREAFAQCLRANSANYSAWLEAGHLCRRMGVPDQASQAYQQAINLNPQRYEAFMGMARLQAQLGELDSAQLAYEHALQAAKAQSTDPQSKVLLVTRLMGQYWLEVGQPRRAHAELNTALQLSSAAGQDINEQALILIDLAIACLQTNNRDVALHLLSRASGATSEITLTKLAQVSLSHNFGGESIEVMERAVGLYPQSADAWSNLAHAQTENWKLQDAHASLARAVSLGAVDSELSMRAALAGKVGDTRTALEKYIQLAELERLKHPQGLAGPMASSAAMSSLYCDHLSPLEVRKLHHDLFASVAAAGSRAPQSFQRSPLEGRRLRVGLVTADMHYQHPVNIFMQPILRELNKHRIELFLYYTNTTKDEQAQLAQRRVEHWHDVTALSIAELASRIDDHQIDVLVDLSGHTSHNRMQLFAQRAAPVQVTYLGYPGSTGVPNIDYLLADAVVAPPQSDALFSENILRFSESVFCYAPEEDYPLPRFTAAMAERPLTFGSFNNTPKLTPRTLALWARVLHAVPNSRLLLKAPSFGDIGAQQLFTERFNALGIDASRLEFRGPIGLPAMMAEYADVDIALDPTPYNGGTTSLQAMWMGVPVLTLQGQSFVSRMGTSFMQAAGLPDWVATTEDDFVAIAQSKSNDRKALLDLKKGLRAHIQALPAWDVARHTREFEDLLLAAGAT